MKTYTRSIVVNVVCACDRLSSLRSKPSKKNETNCVICEVQAEAEETSEHRRARIVSCKTRLSAFKRRQLETCLNGIFTIIYCKSVATVNLRICCQILDCVYGFNI
jgi:hypothetical protein